MGSTEGPPFVEVQVSRCPSDLHNPCLWARGPGTCICAQVPRDLTSVGSPRPRGHMLLTRSGETPHVKRVKDVTDRTGGRWCGLVVQTPEDPGSLRSLEGAFAEFEPKTRLKPQREDHRGGLSRSPGARTREALWRCPKPQNQAQGDSPSHRRRDLGTSLGARFLL